MPDRAVAQTLGRTLLVGVAYYAGAWVGFATTFPDTRIGILWPPNVILLAALLVTPTRWWWSCGLAALVAHVLVHRLIGIPVPVLLVQFAGNAVQAVLAALALRKLGDTFWRENTLRSAIAIIVVAGIAAPAIASAFAAYAYLLAGWLSDYEYAWRVRVVANLVSTLTLAPLVFAIARQGLRGLRDFGWRRTVEFVAVLTGLLLVGALVARSAAGPAHFWFLHAPMPLLLWAAVRFGPAGLSAAFLSLVLLFVGDALERPSITPVPADNVLALQLFLIAIAIPLQLLAALVEERRRAEVRIAESQQRYRVATLAGGVGVWDWDLPTGRMYVDPALKRTLGYTETEIPNTIDAWQARLHPDDVARVKAAFEAHLNGTTPHFEVEHRMVHRDGSVRWFLARGAVRARRSGRPVRMYGTETDVTERKRTEEALAHSHRRIRELAGRVMSAREQERRHIARELHDGLNQRVAALAISISNSKRRIAQGANNPNGLLAELSALHSQTVELSDAVRELSHGLHPAVLEHGGLVAGLRSLVAKFNRLQRVKVAITATGDDIAIPPDAALALYQIAHESILNIARHSGVRHASMALTVGDEVIELVVRDGGRGFDVAGSDRGGGLGLVSIEERARLLNGAVIVTSRPGHGTELVIRIPGPGPSRAPRAAAAPVAAPTSRAPLGRG